MKQKIILDECGDFEQNRHCFIDGVVCDPGTFNVRTADVILGEIQNTGKMTTYDTTEILHPWKVRWNREY